VKTVHKPATKSSFVEDSGFDFNCDFAFMNEVELSTSNFLLLSLIPSFWLYSQSVYLNYQQIKYVPNQTEETRRKNRAKSSFYYLWLRTARVNIGIDLS
jgi:hypothetical protein